MACPVLECCRVDDTSPERVCGHWLFSLSYLLVGILEVLKIGPQFTLQAQLGSLLARDSYRSNKDTEHLCK